MEYEFNFIEVNYGSIAIESDTKPTRDDVIEAIMKGNAYWNHTDYKDIRLCGSMKEKSRSVREQSR
jgi:hypothetical protein